MLSTKFQYDQEEMEEMLRVGQEEVRRLGEEVAQLQTELGEREEDLRMREGQVREKDEEMAELLKAVDTLRKKVIIIIEDRVCDDYKFSLFSHSNSLCLVAFPRAPVTLQDFLPQLFLHILHSFQPVSPSLQIFLRKNS